LRAAVIVAMLSYPGIATFIGRKYAASPLAAPQTLTTEA
jgi:hypothetical protein